MTDLLKTVLQPDAVEAADHVLTTYSVGGKAPTLVLFPKTMSQISQLMLLAKRERKQVIVLGHNSQASLGSVIETPDWCISLHRMNQIVEHEPADLIATVEAGVTLSQLQAFLRPHQQLLPLDVSQPEVRTLGGIVAANAAGPWQLYFGTARDLVLGLKVVLPDGKMVRAGGKTVKNVAGYDLSKLFVGSMGTLGIISEITVKLFPAPAASQTISAQFERFADIPPLIRTLTASNLVITRCEYLNPVLNDQLFALDAAPDRDHRVLLSVQGHPEQVGATAAAIKKLVTSAGGRGLELDATQAEPAPWSRIQPPDGDEGLIQVQFSVPRSRWGNIVVAVEKFGQERAMPLAVHAHAGSGLIHVRWRMALTGAPNDKERPVEDIQRLRQLANQEQGNLVVERAPLELRNPDIIWGEPAESFLWLRRIKSKYDANEQLVAGRFVGGL
jgi:glycolate oxidase FAD binding subunit